MQRTVFDSITNLQNFEKLQSVRVLCARVFDCTNTAISIPKLATNIFFQTFEFIFERTAGRSRPRKLLLAKNACIIGLLRFLAGLMGVERVDCCKATPDALYVVYIQNRAPRTWAQSVLRTLCDFEWFLLYSLKKGPSRRRNHFPMGREDIFLSLFVMSKVQQISFHMISLSRFLRPIS